MGDGKHRDGTYSISSMTSSAHTFLKQLSLEDANGLLSHLCDAYHLSPQLYLVLFFSSSFHG